MIWLLVIACFPKQGLGPVDEEAREPRLVIAHTNDLHTYYEPTPVDVEGQVEMWGGFERIDGLLGELRREHGEDNLLYLDAGDLLTGTPLMEFEHRGVQGGAMLDLIAATGCDAMVLGNHEFDRGKDNVAALVAASEVPIISANLVAVDQPNVPAIPGLKPHIILSAAGERVGVFGLTTADLPQIVNPAALDGVWVRDPIEVAREQVEILSPQVDVIVALTHIGLEPDLDLAAQVDGIDLIVGGHSHTAMESAEEVGSTWVVQAGQYARNVGIALAPMEYGGDWSWSRFDLSEDGPEAGPAVVDLVASWSAKVTERFEVPVGEVSGPLNRDEPGQSGMGKWASDLVREAAGADVGIYNRGGLRSDLGAGPLSLMDLYRVFPFGNEVVSFEWTGAELRQVVEKGLGDVLSEDPARLQWSGIQYFWGIYEGEPRLQELYVSGQPIESERTYRVGTNVFVSWQWEHLLGVDTARGYKGHGFSVFQAAEQRATQGMLHMPADARSIQRNAP